MNSGLIPPNKTSKITLNNSLLSCVLGCTWSYYFFHYMLRLARDKFLVYLPWHVLSLWSTDILRWSQYFVVGNWWTCWWDIASVGDSEVPCTFVMTQPVTHTYTQTHTHTCALITAPAASVKQFRIICIQVYTHQVRSATQCKPGSNYSTQLGCFADVRPSHTAALCYRWACVPLMSLALVSQDSVSSFLHRAPC